MSMISGQIDRLRTAAQTYRKMGNHSAESMFLDAADTITELRGALQVASVDYRHLSEENAKLRELCAELLKMAERHDPEWLHWPEMHDELQKLGVKIVKL